MNPSDATDQLCLACGLCCNGVLFGDVELQRGDDPRQLTRLGLELFRKARKQCFVQPCACFDGRLCSIYEDRPKRCRTFECRLLQRVHAGEATVHSALKRIATARRVIRIVEKLCRELGQTDERLPLNRRYATFMSQPFDLAGDSTMVRQRRRLMAAVARLATILERDFLT